MPMPCRFFCGHREAHDRVVVLIEFPFQTFKSNFFFK